MKVYAVTCIFKSEKDCDKFTCDMDNHPIIKYLSKKNTVKAIDCEDAVIGKYGGVEFYFKLKKDAVVLSKQFKIPVSHIVSAEYDARNPWLPDDCDSFVDSYEIYGDIPGARV
jgi:hypothetical protein